MQSERFPPGHRYPTVGGERAQGYRLAEIWCLNCRHSADVPTDGLPDGTRVIDIWQRFICSRCGSKRLQSRMSIHEHYAVMRERTGTGYGVGVVGTGADLRRSSDGRTAMRPVVITSQEDYERAIARIQELSGAPEDTPEERELIALIEACDAWDRGKGGEVAGDAPSQL